MRHYHHPNTPTHDLPTVPEMSEAAQSKSSQRKVSLTKRGFIKCSGKWSAQRIATIRQINIKIAESRKANKGD